MDVIRGNPDLSPTYVDAAELAAGLGVSRRTVYRWLKLGLPNHQPAGRYGRILFDPDEVREWIKCRCTAKTAGRGNAA